jgi:hypothetical protein
MIAGTGTFSKPITFSKDGSDTYKTVLGGVTTLVIFFLMTIWFVILLAVPYVDETDKTSTVSTNKTLDCGPTVTEPVGVTPGSPADTEICLPVDTCAEFSNTICSSSTGVETTTDDVSFVQYMKAEYIRTRTTRVNDVTEVDAFNKVF